MSYLPAGSFCNRCGTFIQSEKSLRREIVNYTTNNVCCATGAAEAAFRSNTAWGRVALRKRKGVAIYL
jgi:hypothetical protein